MPPQEQTDAEAKFQKLVNIPLTRNSLVDVLAFSSKVFEHWRYMHEHPNVEASGGEMERAFDALAAGMR